MGKPKVIIDTSFRLFHDTFHPDDLRRLNDRVDIVWGRDEPMPLEQFEQVLPEALAVVSGNWARYPYDFPTRAPKLKAIMDVGGGFDKGLNYKACFERGIRVSSSSNAFAQPVAEMALGLALSAGREIAVYDRELRNGTDNWNRREESRTTFMLFGQTVGLIGFGAIAKQLRALLVPFGCRVLVYDPWVSPVVIRDHGCEPVGLEQVMQLSRVVFVLAAPTTENRYLLDREKLHMLQSDAVLVLVSRAHLVDFSALTEMLSEGKIKAGIDVYPVEPVPADAPIRQAERAVLTSHKAGSMWDTYHQIGRNVVDDLELIVQGLPPQIMLQAQPELVDR